MYIYSVHIGDSFFKEIYEENQNLAKIEAESQAEFFTRETGRKVKVKKIAICLHSIGRRLYYNDLPEACQAVVKSIKLPMLTAIANEDFSNDSMTYFMLERGLVNENRDQLSDLGNQIKKAIWK